MNAVSIRLMMNEKPQTKKGRKARYEKPKEKLTIPIPKTVQDTVSKLNEKDLIEKVQILIEEEAKKAEEKQFNKRHPNGWRGWL